MEVGRGALTEGLVTCSGAAFVFCLYSVASREEEASGFRSLTSAVVGSVFVIKMNQECQFVPFLLSFKLPSSDLVGSYAGEQDCC